MAENTLTMMSDDSLMTQQYADTFRRSEHLDPEKALVAAILGMTKRGAWRSSG